MCLCVCHPIPCLSVDIVSLPTTSTTAVPPTPSTTQQITSHSTTPTLPTPGLAPDPEGNTLTRLIILPLLPSISARPSLLSFSVFHSPAHLMTLRWPTATYTHTDTHTLSLFMLQPSFALHLRATSVPAKAWMVHRAQSPTLSYHWLFDAPHTHTHTQIAQSANVCVWACVWAWSGLGLSVLGGYCWWMCLMSFKELATHPALSWVTPAPEGTERCYTDIFFFLSAYTHTHSHTDTHK